MKNLFYKIVVLPLIIAIVLSSCTKNFDKINTDPVNASKALPQQLLAPALVQTVYYNMMRNRNFNNELMQVTVDMSDGDGKVFRYDYRATWSDYLYDGWYNELTNFKDIYLIAEAEETSNKSYQAISLICQSWIYSLLTDTYGDVPYFESNRSKKELGGIKEPKFDEQKVIYQELFKNLEQANELLNAKEPITKASDPVFYGDVSKWKKFGNSLYLRLLLRVSGKDEVSNTAIAKIKEIAETPSAYPVMTSVEESAILRWTGVEPYISPYVNVRAQDFRGSAIASFFIDNLVRWDDPRIDRTLGKSNVNRWGIAPSSNGFEGVESGYVPGLGIVKESYFYAIDQTVEEVSPPPYTLQTDALTGMILNYSELNFILAECALKGWITGSAEDFYKKGVEAGIKQWMPDYNFSIDEYLTNAKMQWKDTADFDAKMELIHRQKYYGLFCTDLQQWFEYRRTGHPVLPKGEGLQNNDIMPARMVYPIYVQSTNPTNYQQVVQRQGLDRINTEVWWQKP